MLNDKGTFSRRKSILCMFMILSVGVLLITKNNLAVIPAAIFTFAYFMYWIRDIVSDFRCWIKNTKDSFSIFGDYADQFINIFTNNKKDKG